MNSLRLLPLISYVLVLTSCMAFCLPIQAQSFEQYDVLSGARSSDAVLDFLFERKDYSKFKTEMERNWQSSIDIDLWSCLTGSPALQDKKINLLIVALHNHLSSAATDLEQIANAQKNTAQADWIEYALADFYLQDKNYDKALSIYTRINPRNFSNEQWLDISFQKAYAYFETDSLKQAVHIFENIAALKIEYKHIAAATYYAGVLNYLEKKYDASLKYLEKLDKNENYKNYVPLFILRNKYALNRYADALQFANKTNVKLIHKDHLSEWHALFGHLAFVQKDYPSSIRELGLYFNGSSNERKTSFNRTLLYQLGYAYYLQSKDEQALGILKELSLSLDELGYESLYIIGNIYIKLNRKEEARKIFAGIGKNLNTKEKKEFANFTYAKLCVELNYTQDAIRSLTPIVQAPQHIKQQEAKELLFKSYAKSSEFQNAYFLLKSLNQNLPEVKKLKPYIEYGYASQKLKEENPSEAKRAFQLLLSTPSELGNYAQFWLGEIYVNENHFDSASTCYQTFINSHSSDREDARFENAVYGLGYAELQQKKYKEALNSFLQIGTFTSFDSARSVQQDALLYIADIYALTKKYDLALAIFNRLIDNKTSHADYAYFQKANIIGITDLAKKENLLIRFPEHYPSSSLVWNVQFALGKTLMNLEKYPQALLLYKELLKKNKESKINDAAIQTQMGLAYINIKQLDSAERSYQRILDQDVHSVYAQEAIQNLESLAIQQNKVGEYTAMLESKGIVISQMKLDSISFHAAEQVYLSNDPSSSTRSLSSYLNEFPSGMYVIKAAYLLATLYERQQDWKPAFTYFQQVLQSSPSPYAVDALFRAAQIANLYLFDYPSAVEYYRAYIEQVSSLEKKNNGRKGLLRTFYKLEDWKQANEIAQALLGADKLTVNDEGLVYFILGKNELKKNSGFESKKYLSLVSEKSAYYSRAQYEIVHGYFITPDYVTTNLEKIINEITLRTDKIESYWLTQIYLLIGEAYAMKRDTFNALATWRSIAERSPDSSSIKDARLKIQLIELANPTTHALQP